MIIFVIVELPSLTFRLRDDIIEYKGVETMKTKMNFSLLMLVVGLILSACQGGGTQKPTEGASEEAPANMANPASVYCEEQGGTLEIRTDANGGQYGVCLFDDGSECDEWAYFRGECQPGESIQGEPAAGMANPASVYCEEQEGKLEIRTGTDGGQYGVCMFEDGTECEEWAYFREECAPGDYDEVVLPPVQPED
jgi:putative hemolysin